MSRYLWFGYLDLGVRVLLRRSFRQGVPLKGWPCLRAGFLVLILGIHQPNDFIFMGFWILKEGFWKPYIDLVLEILWIPRPSITILLGLWFWAT